VTEAYDGDEQEPDVWQYRTEEAEVSDESGTRTATKVGSTAGVAGSEPRAVSPLSGKRPTAGGATVGERPGDGGSWARRGRRPVRRVIRVRGEATASGQHAAGTSGNNAEQHGSVASATEPTDNNGTAAAQIGGERTELASRADENSGEEAHATTND
jgi:hypothetical protein